MNYRFQSRGLSPPRVHSAISLFSTVLLVVFWFISAIPEVVYSQLLPKIYRPVPRQGAHDVFFDFADDDDDTTGDDADGGAAKHSVPGGDKYRPAEIANRLFQHGLGSIFDSLGSVGGGPDIDGGHEPMSGLLSKRQEGFVMEMLPERRATLNIKFGEIQSWQLKIEDILEEESGTTVEPSATSTATLSTESAGVRTLYITFNTCIQPQPSNGTRLPPPQLEMYISNTTTNMNPGPFVTDQPQQVFPVDEGFANATIQVSGNTYLSIVAPNITDPNVGNWTGIYNYEMVASIKEPTHGVESEPNLYLIDSDNSEALLISGNMTDVPKDANLTELTPPYVIFANPNNMTNTHGLRKSFCGMKGAVMLGNQNVDVQVSMTRRGLGHLAKQQFYLRNLNKSTTYDVWLAKANNGTVGGVMYPAMNLTTKLDGNCRVIYDLDFCSEVAYAAPSNITSFPDSKRLAQFYDTVAQSWFQNFTYSLQQVQCNTTQERTFSLARNCTDCANAYKTWLCAVTIPRCADFSSNHTFLTPRGVLPNTTIASRASGPSKLFLENGTIIDLPDAEEVIVENSTSQFRSSSRNILIDQVVAPGRYKEIKPCQDLCFNLVQSCPASLGFACPSGSQLELSYGQRSADGDITCSWLGAAYYLNGTGKTTPLLSGWGIFWIICIGMIIEVLS